MAYVPVHVGRLDAAVDVLLPVVDLAVVVEVGVEVGEAQLVLDINRLDAL